MSMLAWKCGWFSVSNVSVGLEMWLVFSVSNVSVGWEMWSVFSV
jgi:hypothetical protein